MLPVRVEIVTFDFPTGADVALRAELPSRVVGRLPMGRNDRAEGQTESGSGAERRAGRLDQSAVRNRIAYVGEKCRAVVVGRDDRCGLREAGLIAGVEIVVVAEKAGAPANDGLVSDEIRKGGARHDLRQ